MTNNDEFQNMDLNNQISIIRSYLSLPVIEDELVIKRIHEYVEALHIIESKYQEHNNNDPEIEAKLKIMRIPMDVAMMTYNDGGTHPVVDLLVSLEQDMSVGSFDKNYSLVRKNPHMPSTLPNDDYYSKMNGFTLLKIMLIISLVVTTLLTLFYYYLTIK